MKKILSAIAISVSAMMAASTTFAAPEHSDNHKPSMQQHQTQKHNQTHSPKAQAKSNWKVGHQYPTQYRTATHKVDYKHSKKMSKPGRNQQWYKADGRYVLVNTLNHNILKVVGN